MFPGTQLFSPSANKPLNITTWTFPYCVLTLRARTLLLAGKTAGACGMGCIRGVVGIQ
jgi:hypothetical protein